MRRDEVPAERGSDRGLVFHAEAGSFHDDVLSVMEETIQDCGGQGAVVVEDGSPLFEGFVQTL